MAGHDCRRQQRLTARIGRLDGYRVKTTKNGHLLIINEKTQQRGMVSYSKSDHRTPANNLAELRRLGLTDLTL